MGPSLKGVRLDAAAYCSGSPDGPLAIAAATITERTPATPSPSSSTSQSTNTPSTTQLPSARPSTFSEWQLLAVLQRANLLQYFEVFLAQGGDDLQQLLEAQEEEFLEIMALVGMASKPLHVRRMQKALSEFCRDPSRFHLLAAKYIGPPPGGASTITDGALQLLSFLPGLQSQLAAANVAVAAAAAAARLSTSPHMITSPTSFLAASTSSHSLQDAVTGTANVLTGEYLNLMQQQSTSQPPVLNPRQSSHSPEVDVDYTSPTEFDAAAAGYCSPDNPVLNEEQTLKISNCSAAIVARTPHFTPRMVQNKKKISRELLEVMNLSVESPRRLPEFRKYSAIYGRFDAKRKPDKPLTQHEVSVNEAAARICLLQPALLTRRDELFPLARQVVKDAGYHYVKGARRPEHDSGRDSRQRHRGAHGDSSDRSQSPPSSGSSPLPEDDSGSESALTAEATTTTTTPPAAATASALLKRRASDSLGEQRRSKRTRVATERSVNTSTGLHQQQSFLREWAAETASMAAGGGEDMGGRSSGSSNGSAESSTKP